VLTAQYALSPNIKQTCLVFKGFMLSGLRLSKHSFKFHLHYSKDSVPEAAKIAELV